MGFGRGSSTLVQPTVFPGCLTLTWSDYICFCGYSLDNCRNFPGKYVNMKRGAVEIFQDFAFFYLGESDYDIFYSFGPSKIRRNWKKNWVSNLYPIQKSTY